MLVAEPRVSRSRENFPGGFDLHLLQPFIYLDVDGVEGVALEGCRPEPAAAPAALAPDESGCEVSEGERG